MVRSNEGDRHMAVEPQTVSITYASRALGISRGLAYALVVRGEFPVTVLHLGRRLVVPKAALERLLEGTTPTPGRTTK